MYGPPLCGGSVVVVVVVPGGLVVVVVVGFAGLVVVVVDAGGGEAELDEGVGAEPAGAGDAVAGGETDVVAGPVGAPLSAGVKPSSAARSSTLLPSMPRAQMPTPARLPDWANWAAS